MTKQKMTIHQALSELKLIDSKVERKIGAIRPVASYQKGKKIDNRYSEIEFESEVKSNMQSAKALIKRKADIKSELNKSNNSTTVIVGGKKMTVADAITEKTYLDLKKSLRNQLASSRDNNLAEFNRRNMKTQSDLTVSMGNKEIGKDTKPSDEAMIALIKTQTELFLAIHEWHLIDPIKVDKEIEELTVEIETFETEIDHILSTSNATTFIEVE